MTPQIQQLVIGTLDKNRDLDMKLKTFFASFYEKNE